MGRERELALLAAFVESDERPATCVIQGEAGIGKTVLWEEALARARARSERVLSCRPSEAETKLTFAGLGDLLAPVAAETLPALPAPQRRALGVALLLETPDGPPPDMRTIGSALLETLRQLASNVRVLVAVDDVQWIDRASAEALAFAVRRLGDDPVALLLARRSSADDALPFGLDDSFHDKRLARLDIGPLSLGALHRLLRSRLDVTLSRPLLRRIHEAAGGNPFYALELARALRERGGRVDPGQPLPVPATLHELVRHRIAAQTPAVQETLAAVALLATPAVGVVEAAVSSGAAIGEAVRAGLLRLVERRLELTHPLLAAGGSQSWGRRFSGRCTDASRRSSATPKSARVTSRSEATRDPRRWPQPSRPAQRVPHRAARLTWPPSSSSRRLRLLRKERPRSAAGAVRPPLTTTGWPAISAARPRSSRSFDTPIRRTRGLRTNSSSSGVPSDTGAKQQLSPTV